MSVSRLTKAKYLEGAQLARANAESHLLIARLSSENNEFGIGISHLVLTIEEFCKSAVLYVRSIDNSMPIIDLSKYFHSHKTKHDSIQKFINGFLFTAISPASYKDIKNSLSWKNIIFVAILLYAINTLLGQVKTTEDKKLSLEDLRTLGFYVDLSPEDNWQSPQNQFAAKAYDALAFQVNFLLSAFYSYIDDIDKNDNSFTGFIDILVNANLVDKQQLQKMGKTKNH